MNPNREVLSRKQSPVVDPIVTRSFAVDVRFSEIWNPDPGNARCTHHLFEMQVEETPDAIAVIFEDQTLTYRQLNNRANQLAHVLQKLGVRPEVLVGVYLERSLEMIVALLGVLKAGGAYVPLDPNYPSDRLSFILQDTQVAVVLTQSRFVKSLPTQMVRVVCLDSDRSAIAQESRANPKSKVTVENLMYVIYTSGSTGKPKGVMIPHRGICNQLYWRQTTFPIDQCDRVLQSISFSFDPSVWQIFWTLCFGAQLVLPRPQGQQDSAYLVELIASQGITIIALVPSMLRVLLEERGIDRCHRLKHVFCGGEALSLDLQKRFFERMNPDQVLHNVYGPTEASIDATFWTCDPKSRAAIAPIGRPIRNTEIYILDEQLQQVAIAEPGELHIAGMGLARGYLNRPELTAEKFIPHLYSSDPEARLYKTGDLARYLPDGTIEFLGRIDHQVKIRGFRIELGEVEAALNQHPSVGQSVVVSHEDRSGKRLVAYVVSSSEVNAGDLRNFLKKRLPDYMIPSAFILLESLPLNANGKVDRKALPEPELERTIEQACVAPRDEVERELVKIWQRVLGIAAIGIDDSFVELGGDSILAAQIVQQIEQVFERKIPLIAFFQASTIAEVAQLIQSESIFAPMIVPIQPDGTKPPLFGVEVLGKGFSFYRPLAKHLGTEQPIYGLSARIAGVAEEISENIPVLATYYIDAVRSLQPEGPYYFTGVSFGGIVAFEMAQQLQAQGQEVALLGLLDTPPPIEPEQLPVRSLRSQGSAYYKRLLQLRPKEMWERFQVRSLNRCLKSARFERLLRRFYRWIDRPFPDAFQNILYWHRNERVIRGYTPRIYAGRITLFLAKDQIVSATFASDPRLCWQQLTEQPLEVHKVSGEHMTMLQEPHVESLARALKLYLH